MENIEEQGRYKMIFENVPLVIWEEDLSNVKRHLDKLKEKTGDLKKWFDNNPAELKKAIGMIEVIDVNTTSLEFYGADSKQELINNMHRLFSEKALYIFKKILLAVARGETYFAVESETNTFYDEVKAIRMEIKIPQEYKHNFSRAYITTLDISKQKQAEQTLKKQKAYFQQLFDKSPDAIVLMDNRERVIKVNKSFADLFGYREADIQGKNINDLIVPQNKLEEAQQAADKVKEGDTYIAETKRCDKEGREIDVTVHGYPIMLEADQLGIYAVYRDISTRKEEEEKIRYLSYHDQLTGLYNRRYFENEMERLAKSRRYPISIIIADVDELKKINDRYGHREGDRYIKIAANIINSAVREADIVARIGGDEFAVILPETEKEEVQRIKDRILTRCEEIDHELPEPVTISIGTATCSSPGEDLENIFIEADNKMYKFKRA